MSRRRQKRKAGRRARKRAEEAWEAVEAGDLDRALAQVRAALEKHADHPVLWNDYGLILELRGMLREAEKALRHALALAPAYADACANLARVLARRGRSIQAERFARRAVELAPSSLVFREELAEYERALPDGREEDAGGDSPEPELEDPFDLGRFDWDAIARGLERDGWARLESLLSRDALGGLLACLSADNAFEGALELPVEAGGGGTYRILREPLPPPLAALRALVYARLAPAADRREERLGEARRFPPSHAEFLAECAARGQVRPAVRIVRYRAPAAREPHREADLARTFPFELAVLLSRRAGEGGGGFEGGTVLFAEPRGRRRVRESEVAVDAGDGLVFCARDRLVTVGGAYGLSPFYRGLSEVTAGELRVLEVPFHTE